MYAVIETGGKQYRVEVGTELEVELLDVEPGQSITLERVLLVADGAEAAVGTPVVDGAAVEAEVLRRDRGDKVIAFKYRPKARRRVKKGHRQELTVLRIADIRFGGKSAAEAEGKAKDREKTERQKVEAAAARQAAEDAALAAKLAVGAEKAEAAGGEDRHEVDRQGRAQGDRRQAGRREGRHEAGVGEDRARQGDEGRQPEGRRRPTRRRPARRRQAPRRRRRPPRPRRRSDEAPTDAAPKRSRTKKDE